MNKTDLPFWSVCIPTRNRGDYLGPAIESVLSQSSGRNLEIVVCDNVSTDNTAQVMERYRDDRIVFRQYDSSTSMYGNHNRCIDVATGKWILFLHSDDTLPAGCMDGLESAIEQSPDADLLTDLCLAGVPLDVNATINDADSSRIVDRTAALVMAAGGGVPSGSVYRRSTFDQCGGFDDDHLCSDATLTLGWILQKRNVVHYRHREPVWVVKDCSTTASPQFIRDHWRDARHRFSAGLDHSRQSEVREEFCEIYRRMPVQTRIQILYFCLAAGRRSLAAQCLVRDPGRLRIMTKRSLYTRVIPTAACPAWSHSVWCFAREVRDRLKARQSKTLEAV